VQASESYDVDSELLLTVSSQLMKISSRAVQGAYPLAADGVVVFIVAP
jgi:hypothetical protein